MPPNHTVRTNWIAIASNPTKTAAMILLLFFKTKAEFVSRTDVVSLQRRASSGKGLRRFLLRDLEPVLPLATL